VLCVTVVLAVSAIGTKIKERERESCFGVPFLVVAYGKERGGAYRDSNDELAR
jgi:hypothetical protein